MNRNCWIAISLVLAGCAGSPSTNYYTLSVENACTANSSIPAMGKLEPTTVRLPGILDRPQLVIRTDPHTVLMREFERWAEPLDQMATRILAEDLAICQSSPGLEGSEYLLSVSVDEFMVDTSGRALLTGRWWVARKGENAYPLAGQQFTLVGKAGVGSGAESAAAMSALLGKLAGEIARGTSQVDGKKPRAAS